MSHHKKSKHTIDAIIRWRWWIVLFFAVVMIVFEIVEHQPTLQNLDIAWLLETFVYGITLPVLLGVVLGQYQSRTRLEKVVSQDVFEHHVQAKLASTRDWDELATTLLQVPRTLFPLLGDALFLLDRQTGRYYLAAQWASEGFEIPISPGEPYLEPCPPEIESGTNVKLLLAEEGCLSLEASSKFRIGCLPLWTSGERIGLLQFYFDIHHQVDPSEFELCQKLAPVMALAIEGQNSRKQSYSYTNAVEAERRRIARYLHDSLLPNLAYLRLQLDQFVEGISSDCSAAVNRELGRMIQVADESYENTREVLSGLHNEDTIIRLREALREVLGVVEKRTGIDIHFSQTGEEGPLLPTQVRMLLLVIREALRNIENHAQASSISVHLDWGAENIHIEVQDNGIGFEARALQAQKGHYGLRMIEEVATELCGEFQIHSTPGSGTQLSFWFPRPTEIANG